MVERGARHLALVGRRAPDARALEAIGEMEAAGARVLVAKADVSRREDVDRVLLTLRRDGPPLRGVVHAAGVLDDHTLLELSAESFRTVFAPKALGALHLHQATLGQELAFFLAYSSGAALFGSPGQGNYAAANAFLDALARLRDRTGHPSMSVQWGPFSDVGLAAAQDNRGGRLSHRGITSFTPEEGLQTLRRLFDHPRSEVGVVRIDLRQWIDFHPRAAGLPFIADLVKEGSGAIRGARDERARELLAQLGQAVAGERLPLLERHVQEQLGSVLHLDPAHIDRSSPLSSLGIDSLISLELRNRLEASLGLRLSATLLFTYPTVASLARYLAERVFSSEPAEGQASELPIQSSAETDMKAKLDLLTHEALTSLARELLS
jgi:acyl carrier protein